MLPLCPFLEEDEALELGVAAGFGAGAGLAAGTAFAAGAGVSFTAGVVLGAAFSAPFLDSDFVSFADDREEGASSFTEGCDFVSSLTV